MQIPVPKGKKVIGNFYKNIKVVIKKTKNKIKESRPQNEYDVSLIFARQYAFIQIMHRGKRYKVQNVLESAIHHYIMAVPIVE